MTASYRDFEAPGIATALAQAAPDGTGRAPRKPVTEGLR